MNKVKRFKGGKLVKEWRYGSGWRTIIVDDTPMITKPGVFEKNGEIFVVKPTRDKERMYALKLVEAPSKRLTEMGEHVDFDFEYAKGAIYNLSEADRMPLEEAKKLMIKYGRCIVCGKRLKVAISVERGIGPVCIKYFKR